MDLSFWPKFFENIRPEDQESLMIFVQGGLEVAVQQVVRVEESMVMIRGRVSGQAIGGRLFLLPYEKLGSVFVNRNVTAMEAELFSPDVSLERKEEVARQVAEAREKERQQASEIQKSASEKRDVPIDMKAKLDELRRQAGLGGAEPAPAVAPPPPAAAKPAEPKPSESPLSGLPPKPSLPPKFTIPKPPQR